MKNEYVIAGVAGLVLLVVAAFIFLRRRPKQPQTHQFMYSWKELQLFCKHPETWRLALESADNLLDKALKVHRFKGKSMGERLVDAQRDLSDNEGVWYAHNLAKKAVSDSDIKFTQKEVKHALIGFRQALKDLGALDGERAAN